MINYKALYSNSINFIQYIIINQNTENQSKIIVNKVLKKFILFVNKS